MAWTEEQLDDALEAQFNDGCPLSVAVRRLDSTTFSGLTEADAIAAVNRLVTAARLEECCAPFKRPPIINEAYWMLRTYRVIGD